MPDHDAVDGLAIVGIDAICIEREAHYILTNAYGERAVAKNLWRVVPIDNLLSALVHVATTFDFASPSQTRAGSRCGHRSRSGFFSRLYAIYCFSSIISEFIRVLI